MLQHQFHLQPGVARKTHGLSKKLCIIALEKAWPQTRQVQVHVFDKFKDLISQVGVGSDAKRNDAAEEAELVRIDTESRRGLGGTSDDAFGPLVRERSRRSSRLASAAADLPVQQQRQQRQQQRRQ